MKASEHSFRSELGRARGLGSAHDGTAHAIAMKLTALALIPLTIWFVYAVLNLMQADVDTVRAWFHVPAHAVLMFLFIAISLKHSAKGLQVVIEDYIHCPHLKMALLIANKLGHVLLAGFALFAVLLLALKTTF